MSGENSQGVLIVDDERDFVTTLRAILEDRAYEVESAHGAEEAEDRLRDSLAAVCLVDIRLGQANGLDLVARIRDDYPNKLCVLMTGYTDTTTAIRAVKEGAYDYLLKPFDADDLLATLDRCFARIKLEGDKAAAEEQLKRRNEELARINSRLEQMVQAASELAACQSQDELSRLLLKTFAANMAADGGSLFIAHEDRLERAHSLDPEHVPVSIPLPLSEQTVLGTVCATRRPLVVGDIASQGQLMPSGWKGYKNGSLLVLPLIDREDVLLGVISLHNKRWPPFTRQDIDLGLVLVSVSLEIMRSLRTLRELEESREYFRELIENSLDVTVLLEPDGRIRYASPSAERITGYPLGMIIGRRLLDFVHPDDVAGLEAGIEDILNEPGKTFQVVTRVRIRDGSWRVLESAVRNALESSAVRGIVVNSRDVTDRLLAESAVRKSEEKYRYLFENSYAVNVVIGMDGEILDHNDTLHYSGDELVNRKLVEFVVPEDRDRVTEALAAGQRGEETDRLEIRVIDGTGSVRTVFFPGGKTIFLLDGDRKVGYLATGVDITELKRAEERARAQEEQLFQASKLASLGTLVSGVAHEMNNPISFIRLVAENLRGMWPEVEELLDASVAQPRPMVGGLPYDSAKSSIAEMIKGLEEGSSRIEALVNNLKNYSRKDAGDLKEEVDLQVVLDHATRILGNTIKQATSQFAVEVADDLPRIRGNTNRLEQVVINLISNACQSLDSSEAEIRLTATYDKVAEEVRISVTDQGVGIPADVLPQITDPFFTTKRDAGGTGLGLSISYRIVENHGGRMLFDSSPGRGTVVSVYLPASGTSPS